MPDLAHIRSLIVVSGLSGAGKSTALNALDDLGYNALDNLPVPLFVNFLEFTAFRRKKYARTALLLNIQSNQDLTDLNKILKKFPEIKEKIKFIFLDATTDNIVKRYSETRRPHPGFNVQTDRSIEDAIERERARYLTFKNMAHQRIDTSSMTVHDLKREIKDFVDSLKQGSQESIRVNFVSFGFKKGIPQDCDLVVDVRFLPNPHYIESLREKTGLDAEVSNYVLDPELTQDFLKRYIELLKFLLPNYIYEGKAYLSIGVGCTAGRHRSVAIAEKLAKEISYKDCLISVKHRDLVR